MQNVLPMALILIAGTANGIWIQLAPGIELGTFSTSKTSPVGDSRITIVRVQPELWEFEVLGVDWIEGSREQTAKQWCSSQNMTAAINAGMFAAVGRMHMGYFQSRGRVNNAHVNKKYLSVAAFHPKEGKKLREFQIFDLDDPETTMSGILGDYSSVIQNLRLIKKPGENRWGQQAKIWSEAALGEDSSGRVLFIFSRSPFSMRDFNNELLGLGIGVVAAQHLEGGPEAQLYIKIGDVEREYFGSYETSFREDDDNASAWPVPNVIGIHPRESDSRKPEN